MKKSIICGFLSGAFIAGAMMLTPFDDMLAVLLRMGLLITGIHLSIWGYQK